MRACLEEGLSSPKRAGHAWFTADPGWQHGMAKILKNEVGWWGRGMGSWPPGKLAAWCGAAEVPFVLCPRQTGPLSCSDSVPTDPSWPLCQPGQGATETRDKKGKVSDRLRATACVSRSLHNRRLAKGLCVSAFSGSAQEYSCLAS